MVSKALAASEAPFIPQSNCTIDLRVKPVATEERFMLGACSPGMTSDVSMACVGSLLTQLVARPVGEKNGNKCDARIMRTYGGSSFNCAHVGAVNNVPTAAITTMRRGMLAHWSRTRLKAAGIRPVFQVSKKMRAGITLATPNGRPKHLDLWVQRPGDMTREWPTEEIRHVLAAARVVIQGPIRLTEAARNWLVMLPALAPQAYRMLIPHLSLIESEHFALIARKFDGVFMNFPESCKLPGAETDLAKNSCRLGFLTKYAVDFAITNAGAAGMLFAAKERSYRIIQPRPDVRVLSDDAAGDTFTSAWCVGRHILGLSIDSALDYAVDAAAHIIAQEHPKTPIPYRPLNAPPAPQT